jgi:UDPglucose 6-dehydrogenase
VNTKIAVCGVGRLGLPLALNLGRVKAGEVIGFDINQELIIALNNRSFRSKEPDVHQLLLDTDVKFSACLDDLHDADFIVVCIRTDSLDSGAYDLTQLWQLIDNLQRLFQLTSRVNKKRALAINCNVNPGTSRSIAKILEPFGIEVYFWPEWVKQGSVVHDQTHPEVSILGAEPNYQTKSLVRSIIAKLDIEVKLKNTHELNLIDAELAKIALNCFLTVKISFANMIGNLLDEIGINATAVLTAISDDSRIGRSFFNPGFGYGGPCLPRDNAALISFASSFGVELPLCTAADRVNALRRQNLFKMTVRDHHLNGSTPVIESLAYKKGVPIYTESQQLQHASSLISLGIPTEVSDQDDLDVGHSILSLGRYLLQKQKKQ